MKHIVNINFTNFFSIFKMWLLENTKLHMWVILYLHWTMLTVYPTSFISLHC